MAATSRLCDRCCTIPFDTTILTIVGQKPTWYLGSMSRVQDSTCRMCRLVVTSLNKAAAIQRLVLKPDTLVKLTWERSDILQLGSCSFCASTMEYPVVRAEIHFVQDATDAYSVKPNHNLLPNYGKSLDFERVKHWLTMCADSHGDECVMDSPDSSRMDLLTAFGRHVSRLRFIDVIQDCVVEVVSLPPFVALSYVWGSVSNVRLTTYNHEIFSTPRAFQKHREMLPLTIRDAMAFVRGIGQRFLWCDAFCLMQNDTFDIKGGIDIMDVIYEKSLLTIVAASGHDANAGLPGVRPGTRDHLTFPQDVLPGIQLDACFSLERLMRHTVYTTRAWTFQEEGLAKRKIYFVDGKVYFRCQATTTYEGFVRQLDIPRRTPNIVHGALLAIALRWERPVDDYKTLLVYYSQRILTYQADAMRAMMGNMYRASRFLKCRLFQGLPTATFDIFLLFHRGRSSLYRRDAFPSYSWAGWRGSIDFFEIDLNNWWLNDWLSEETWIVWYQWNPPGFTDFIWNPREYPEFPSEDEDVVGYRQRRPFKPPYNLGFQTHETQPTNKILNGLRLRAYPILQFWTLSIFFNLVITDVMSDKASILDKNGNLCGTMYLDGLETMTLFDSKDSFELIALSGTTLNQCNEPRFVGEGGAKEELGSGFYNVMLLEWSGSIAERRGLGSLRRSAIKNSLPPGPSWKEICLA